MISLRKIYHYVIIINKNREHDVKTVCENITNASIFIKNRRIAFVFLKFGPIFDLIQTQI